MLLAVPHLGRHSIRRIQKTLKDTESSWEDFWVGKGSLWQKCQLTKKQQQSIKKFKKEHTIDSYWESLRERGIRVVCEWENDYPSLLFETEDRPIALFVKHQCFSEKAFDLNDYLGDCPIGVVGTRKMTAYGRRVTQFLISQLSEGGSAIISGSMYGVDMCAQQAALATNPPGRTVGVLGFGFDHWYPRSTESFREELLQKGGVLVSEYAPEVAPQPGQFATRNRIIAGLSLGVVVTEAGEKSGSHITAQCALEEGRAVYALPGSIFSPYSEGTKWLINEGATCVSSAMDIWQDLGMMMVSVGIEPAAGKTDRKSNKKTNQKTNSNLAGKIQELLRDQVLTLEEIANEIQEDEQVVLSQITQLEIAGCIIRTGQRYQLV